jgi:hypothetical protein
MTTLVAGFGLCLAAQSIEKRTPRCERIDHFFKQVF